LPDLNQDNSYVREYLKTWIHDLVQKYDFDGIRIDTIPEVKGQFWSEYGQASGVFQMGECFNGDPNYVGPYQQDLTGLFNYPMYYTIKDVFGGKQSMNQIGNRYNGEGAFKDLSTLGVFVDNHDNARFLNQYNDRTSFKSALTFALTSEGIPFFYYGSEQYYSGGNDPQNRESLWQAMNTDSDVYKMMAKVNSARKTMQIWNQQHLQRYSDDTFYAFSRGEFLVAVTNSHNDQQRDVTYQPFADGTTVCNIFYPTTDCQTVNGKVNVYLAGGESKIYVPQSRLSEMNLGDEEILKFLQN
jgi:alpha-amylase